MQRNDGQVRRALAGLIVGDEAVLPSEPVAKSEVFEHEVPAGTEKVQDPAGEASDEGNHGPKSYPSL
jgi:hypothetical protein